MHILRNLLLVAWSVESNKVLKYHSTGCLFHTCGLCEGNCKKHSECKVGLACFQRHGHETVPLCDSGGVGDVNGFGYCTIYPTPSPTASPTLSPTPSPTSSPTLSPTPSPTPSPTRSPTPRPTPSPTRPNYVWAHHQFSRESFPGNYYGIASSDGRWVAHFEGNHMRVRRRSDGWAKWTSSSRRHCCWHWLRANRAVLQSDGHFLTYDSEGKWVWKNNKDGRGHTKLTLYTDGNMCQQTTGGNNIWCSSR